MRSELEVLSSQGEEDDEPEDQQPQTPQPTTSGASGTSQGMKRNAKNEFQITETQILNCGIANTFRFLAVFSRPKNQGDEVQV